MAQGRKTRVYRKESDPVLAKLSVEDRAVVLGVSTTSADNGLEYAKRIRLANVKAVGDIACPAWFVETQLEVMKLQQAAIATHIAEQAAKVGQ
jgi:hypothetical protein